MLSRALLAWSKMCDAEIVLQISTVIGAALPSERAQNGWTEGVAIWVAVIIVSLVGESIFRIPSQCRHL